MLRSDADAPKPPAYPFISITVKERSRHKTSRTLLPASLPALPPEFFATTSAATSVDFVLRFSVASSSVRRYLRIRPGDCKRKNDRLMTIFSATQENLGFRARENAFSVCSRPCRPRSSRPSGGHCGESDPGHPVFPPDSPDSSPCRFGPTGFSGRSNAARTAVRPGGPFHAKASAA